MANMETNRNDDQEMTVLDKNGKKICEKKPKEHRKMKPWVKWTLIGVGSVLVVGGVAFLIVNGKKVPAKEMAEVATKAAEVVATDGSAAVTAAAAV